MAVQNLKKLFITIQLILAVLVLLGLVSCNSFQYAKSFGFVHKEVIEADQKDVLDLDLSDDGRYLASAGTDTTVRFWDTKDMSLLGIIEDHPDEVYAVDFDSATSMVATGCRDGAVRVYELPSGELLHTMRGHAEAVYSVAFSSDGRQVVSGGKDSTVRVWSVQNGELLRVFRGHSEEVNTVTTYKDMAYSASRDGTVRSWFLGDQLAPGMIEKIARLSAVNVEVSPDGKRLAVTGIHTEYREKLKKTIETFPLFIADLKNNELQNIEKRYGHKKHAWGLAWSPDGKTIVTGGPGERLVFRDVDNASRQRMVLPRAGNIWDIEYSPDGNRIYVATQKKGILIYSKQQ